MGKTLDTPKPMREIPEEIQEQKEEEPLTTTDPKSLAEV